MTEARDVRMGMYGHSNQASHHIMYMYDVRRAALEDAGEGPRGAVAGSTSAARSARATRATRTTARCRPGTSSARSASTRCRMGSADYAIGSPLFTKATVHLENGKKLVVKAPKQQRGERLRAGPEGQRQAYDRDVPAARRCSRTAGRWIRHGPGAVGLGHRAGRRAAVDHPGHRAAAPLRDVTAPEGALFDDDSRTTGGRRAARGHAAGRRASVLHADLGPDGAEDPRSWVLRARSTARRTVLDQRRGSVRLALADPRVQGRRAGYAHYRLEPGAAPRSARSSCSPTWRPVRAAALSPPVRSAPRRARPACGRRRPASPARATRAS